MRRQYHSHSNTAGTERQFSNLGSKASPGPDYSSEGRASRYREVFSSKALSHICRVPCKCQIGAANNPVRICGRELRMQANIYGSEPIGLAETRQTLPRDTATVPRVQP
jgi:hypothetical protein